MKKLLLLLFLLAPATLLAQSKLNDIYSTSETVVGEWFGSALYRKCFVAATFPNNSTIQIAHGISGLTNDEAIFVYGRGNDAAGDMRSLPLVWPSATLPIGLTVDATYIELYSAGDWGVWSGHVCLEYVK